MPKSELPTEEHDDSQFDKEDDINVNFNGKNNSVEPQFIEEEEKNEETIARKKFLSEVFKVLNLREKDMVYMYYGIYGRYYKLNDIGQKYSLTKERVRQIIEGALRKTRCKAMVMENKYL